MVPDKLRIALRAVIHAARNEGKTGEIILQCPPDEHRQLRVRAIRADKEENGLLLVTFEYEPLGHAPDQAEFDSESWARRQLQDDLRTTQLDLEASIQALEANNMELHLANEEVMSTERGTAIGQRGIGDLEGRAAIGQRGAGHSQQ